ncbi:hypothetical protein AA103196_1313 [Ameyamaea chiangmaiensis NBRC 103196]|uniref:DUF1491 family protein n=1 Tax=Ameyamaea chiangmaiensis TaxID=442969 RepID=A0A850PEL1_9PROT|nr:DUF1491 family protein [Ameyamaea chiangmaiensis]MBS4075134.1 DUF1491 family protein [Ameyamaea chiangmaiensis]NVN40696.1 DUF1491 family protein [Ameyamaea chiangmaiensis]GBQ66194.1 hypothetical protein AA103196_1313 [Ameyamaea chiangmaiensis NBRC 103196]
MTEVRLKTGLWARAVLRQAVGQGWSAMVLRRGDEDAGGVLVVLMAGRDALSVLSQTRTADGDPAWLRATGPDPVDQATVDAYVARQLSRDPDLWVLEFEVPTLHPPFEANVLPS